MGEIRMIRVQVRETFRNKGGNLYRELEIHTGKEIEATIPIMKIRKNKGLFFLEVLVDEEKVINVPCFKKKRDAVKMALKWEESKIMKRMVLNHISRNFHVIYFCSKMNEKVQDGLRKIVQGISNEVSGNGEAPQIRKVF